MSGLRYEARGSRHISTARFVDAHPSIGRGGGGRGSLGGGGGWGGGVEGGRRGRRRAEEGGEGRGTAGDGGCIFKILTNTKYPRRAPLTGRSPCHMPRVIQ